MLQVLRRIGPEVSSIYIVDDACPEQSGREVESSVSDPRVHVLYHRENRGVGAATITGMRRALEDGADVVVKIDGDGQMDPALLPQFIRPILAGYADYAKGNRFFDLEHIAQMPRARVFGNAALSFMAKLSTGYWDIFDPTNGYIAIHSEVLRRLPLKKISERFFFETDVLFRLNTIRAVVVDVPMDAVYREEVSNLRIGEVLGEFVYKHTKNLVKRIFYNYFLRDMSIASLELVSGILLLLFGITFGSYHWITAIQTGASTPAGTVMLSALPILMGLQFLLAFLAFDIASTPRKPLHVLLHSGPI